MTAPQPARPRPDVEQDDDEISLQDLVRALIGAWRWLAAGSLLGLAVAVLYLTTVPAQFEAVALVRIGQLGQPGQSGQSAPTLTVPVEAPARTVERLMFPTFRDQVIAAAGWPPGSPTAALYASSLKATLSKGSDLIEIRLRGSSPEEAGAAITATIAQLAAQHKALAEPVVESLRSELNEITIEAAALETMLKDLDRMTRAQSRALPQDRVTESILYVQLMTAKEGRLRELKRHASRVREWIAPTGTSVTSLFAPASVGNVPVAPKKMQTLLLGTLAGLLLGAVAAWLARVGRRESDPAASA